MFKEIGQLAGMMGQMPRIREEMEKLQQRLPQLTAEGDAGAGMVKVRVNGRLDVTACVISEEIMKLGDREMLEDLIRGATNQAIAKVRQQIADETAKMASNLGLPPGMGLPGMPGLT
ncbi:MAG TPA: YbaB/EbfC family nucleoid-associated protein [Planctomycetales bacterium]|jgi:DNA-binding YbaB/EbfC family protein|nr:YbaB/EbfC family nucleoid-associated protein [Planctomycetales bacterium]